MRRLIKATNAQLAAELGTDFVVNTRICWRASAGRFCWPGRIYRRVSQNANAQREFAQLAAQQAAKGCGGNTDDKIYYIKLRLPEATVPKQSASAFSRGEKQGGTTVWAECLSATSVDGRLTSRRRWLCWFHSTAGDRAECSKSTCQSHMSVPEEM